MFSFFIQLLPFSNMMNNLLFIQNHSNLSYDVEENQFINRTYINNSCWWRSRCSNYSNLPTYL